ncbi:hypothetical protein MNBD_GAMMA01-366 [hydrothermal vent metagenome]|uniref:Peptidase M14 domain-containing protein n=1 Tax=hydrothermal vent metagenome TaxID=652676 RepID=A0A3B0UY33_9ZZZZ
MKSIALLFLMGCSCILQAQSITSWTEEDGILGLGYPVPIAVDTPEPFDGFRTYSGLFAKHQSLALNNPYITGHIVGKTRYERDIWAYVLSDEDNLTKYGIKEGAMLINGGIHAREWQSPEVLTGIIELLDTNSQDQSLHQYLLENTAIITIPVNNVDGFLQTQRYPQQNWYSNQIGPRDGRMRRKNMLDVDEDLFTETDYLYGVDLNRNNAPYWATSNSSSPNATSIVYHGALVHSEPETQARLNAADLVATEQLRLYTDVHSFTLVHFSVTTNIANRNTLQSNLLKDFSNHHYAFPAAKYYADSPSASGSGLGLTTEYFASTFQVPSWTLEIEPTYNGGADYGGFNRNGHDGFILPESEITRVREQLAQTFMVTWYAQAGPPAITQFRVVEKETGITVYDASWDIQADGTRELIAHEIENILAGGEYSLIVTFDKPMRTRDESNQIVHLQGQNLTDYALNPDISASINGNSINLNLSNEGWINQQTTDVFSYKFYKDDTYSVDFIVPDDVDTENTSINWSIDVADMVGQRLDSDPQTVVTWANGQWQNYEDSNDQASIIGGVDSSYSVVVSDTSIYSFAPMIQPTGLYYDPSRSGEGFSYELLGATGVWLQWFTYDADGNQKWYSGVGQYSANKITINNLTETHGGTFGEDFNPENIYHTSFGSLEIIFNGGEAIIPAVGSHDVARTAKVLYTDVNGKKLRTNLHQLSYVKGAINDIRILDLPVVFPEPVGLITGSWYDPNRSGEGYIIEILEDNRAILLFYTYDLAGNHMWLLGSSGVINAEGNNITLDFNNVIITDGGIFGEDFNPNNVNRVPWGELQFELNCTGTGVVSYFSDIFGSGQYTITKLTNPLTLPFVCDEK